jgi:hypothetical protein
MTPLLCLEWNDIALRLFRPDSDASVIVASP